VYPLCFYVKITATKINLSFTWSVGEVERIQEHSFGAGTLEWSLSAFCHTYSCFPRVEIRIYKNVQS
jgi:hypothetical protein